MKVVALLETRDVVVECPHCHETNDGFVVDPRGHQFQCDYCKQEFKVHPEADIEWR